MYVDNKENNIKSVTVTMSCTTISKV